MKQSLLILQTGKKEGEKVKENNMRFDELMLSDDLLDALDAMRFEECTPVQAAAIPHILEGRDLMAVAQTGTGKTAAYLLPVIDMIAGEGLPQDSINCVVMSPTRELAQQIDQQMEGFAYFMPVSSLAVYGGTDGHVFEQQRKGLKMGADVVIATPGRLIAHLSMGYVDLSKVSFFILDEADRMLDMGFYDDIMQIVSHLPKERQTLMFSATMPPKIRQLASAILNDPAEVKLAVSKPADKIVQSAFVCYEPQKLPFLKHLLKSSKTERVIVFAASKLKVKELSRALRQSNINVGEMHSDLDQERRDEVMLGFKAGRIKVLVATDIVARGIDIDDINMVVNYDVPREAEDYVHRIGRTARANADGRAVTFVSVDDMSRFGRIEKFLGYEVTKEQAPASIGETPEYTPSRRPSRGGSSGAGKGKSASGKGDGRRDAAKKDGNFRRNRNKGRKPAEASMQPKQKNDATNEATKDAAQTNDASRKPKRRNNHRRRKKANPDSSSNPGQPQDQ